MQMKFWNILWTWFCFKLVILDSYNPAKVHPSTQKIRKVTLQDAPENPKKVCKGVCKSQKVCPHIEIQCLLFARFYFLFGHVLNRHAFPFLIMVKTNILTHTHTKSFILLTALMHQICVGVQLSPEPNYTARHVTALN